MRTSTARPGSAGEHNGIAPPFRLTTFDNDTGYDDLVVVANISFGSSWMREQQLSGLAHVGYVPDGHIVGLSKLARAVEMFAARIDAEEPLAARTAEWLGSQLAPKGVGVVIEIEHRRLAHRAAPVTSTVTSSLHGTVRDDPRTRAEFLGLVRRR
ncbi:MAG TPA: GTP cyclohydrolase I [Acidimicrobiia bacterium]|jgi:GTP cyclohydrolase I